MIIETNAPFSLNCVACADLCKRFTACIPFVALKKDKIGDAKCLKKGKIAGTITSLVSVSLTEPEFPQQVFIVLVAHE